jgi:hypothetical protein
MAHGTWHMAHGTWHMAHGTWHMAHGMLEVLRECSTLYEWGVGDMANHMGYVKNAIIVFIFRTLNLN